MRVLILDKFAEEYAARLGKEFPQLDIEAAATIDAIGSPLAEFDVLVTFGIAINDQLLAGLSGLRWVQSLATGTDHFTDSPAFRKEILLTSARGIHGAPMRETIALLMLSLARDMRRIVRDQLAGHWDRGSPWTLLEGKTAVLVGVGVSSIAVAQLLKAFGMRVIGVSNAPRDEPGFDKIMSRNALAQAAGKADFLVNILPGGSRNAHAINAEVFNALPQHAFFINVGRGETVDENALLDVLRAGKIAGAGLDVFAGSPLPPDSPFWTLENVIVSPHIAGFFSEYEDYVLPIIIDNMRAFVAGDIAAMRNVVQVN